MNDHSVMIGNPSRKARHAPQSRGAPAGHRQELMIITGEQIDVPVDWNAEPGVYDRAVAVIGQEQDIQVDLCATGYELVEGCSVLYGVGVDDTKSVSATWTRPVAGGDVGDLDLRARRCRGSPGHPRLTHRTSPAPPRASARSEAMLISHHAW